VCWAYPVIITLKCFGAGLIGLCTFVNNKPLQCHGLLHTRFDDIQAPISYVSFQLFVCMLTCTLTTLCYCAEIPCDIFGVQRVVDSKL
jgi:hypothetical protein